MTAIALTLFDQRPAQAAAPRELAPRRAFQKLVEDKVREDRTALKDPKDDLLDNNSERQNDALLALLETIPQAEMPSGGVPEAIATEVSVVVDVPEEIKTAGITTTSAIAASFATSLERLLPKLASAQGLDLLPIARRDGIATTSAIVTSIERPLPTPAMSAIVTSLASSLEGPLPTPAIAQGNDLLPLARRDNIATRSAIVTSLERPLQTPAIARGLDLLPITPRDNIATTSAITSLTTSLERPLPTPAIAQGNDLLPLARRDDIATMSAVVTSLADSLPTPATAQGSDLLPITPRNNIATASAITSAITSLEGLRPKPPLAQGNDLLPVTPRNNIATTSAIIPSFAATSLERALPTPALAQENNLLPIAIEDRRTGIETTSAIATSLAGALPTPAARGNDLVPIARRAGIATTAAIVTSLATSLERPPTDLAQGSDLLPIARRDDIATTSAIVTSLVTSLATSLERPLPTPAIARGLDLLPIAIGEESSDGIPTTIEAGPRPRSKPPVDDEAQTAAMVIPPTVRELRLAGPTVDGTKPVTKAIKLHVPNVPDAVPVIQVVAKLAPVARQPFAPQTPLEQAVQALISELDDDQSNVIDTHAMVASIPEVKLLSTQHADAPVLVTAGKARQSSTVSSDPSHVHLVIDDRTDRVVITKATPSAIVTSFEGLLPKPAIAQGRDLLPLAIEEEHSDGIPTPTEAAPRPHSKRPVDEEAQTTAMVTPPAVRELRLTGPAVDGTKLATKAITIHIPKVQKLPNAVPVIQVVAKLAAVAQQPFAPLTPLEQAVQALISSLDDDDSNLIDTPAMVASIPEVKLLSIQHADAPAPVTAVKEPQVATQNSNPSHVHLVIDDGADRVVVTVAVRGNEVNVALRGQDEATTAALARNAGSLDHAMRARGLELTGMMTQRDPESQKQRPDRDAQERERGPKELFSIEELA